MPSVVIIGGGPAGAAAAIRMAQANNEVVIVDRHEKPTDKVCGEFLSQEACFYLSALGLDLPSLGAVPVHHLRFCQGNHVATVRLPFSAMGLSRRALDEALVQRAVACGATLRRGRRVTELHRAGENWRMHMEDLPSLDVQTLFLATGKQDLKSFPRPRGDQSDLIAFKQHWQLSAEQQDQLAGNVELILFQGGYAGLQPIERRRANLCLLVRRQRFRDTGHRWDELLRSIRRESGVLNQRLAGGQPLHERPLALSAIPYGHVQKHSEGLWRLGDQAAVIASFTGDGLSIALHSGELAAQHFLSGASPHHYQQRLARDVEKSIRLSTRLSRGMVRPSTQRVFGLAAHLWPGLVGLIARATRVPATAMVASSTPSQQEICSPGAS